VGGAQLRPTRRLDRGRGEADRGGGFALPRPSSPPPDLYLDVGCGGLVDGGGQSGGHDGHGGQHGRASWAGAADESPRLKRSASDGLSGRVSELLGGANLMLFGDESGGRARAAAPRLVAYATDLPVVFANTDGPPLTWGARSQRFHLSDGPRAARYARV
jgi:hypothetical protein